MDILEYLAQAEEQERQRFLTVYLKGDSDTRQAFDRFISRSLSADKTDPLTADAAAKFALWLADTK